MYVCICYAQTINPWIGLRKVMIDALCNIICAFHGLSTLLFAQSMDLAHGTPQQVSEN